MLDFSAAEVADLLDTSVPAVNSALQRARAATAVESEVVEPDEQAARAMVDRYVAAFEAADVDTLVTLLTEDAVLEMPPVPLWYRGRVNYGRFIARAFALRGTDWKMVDTVANGQPAAVAYCRGDDGAYHLHTLQVFTVTTAGIAHTVVFQDPAVFAAFHLPAVSGPGAALARALAELSLSGIPRLSGLPAVLAKAGEEAKELPRGPARTRAGRDGRPRNPRPADVDHSRLRSGAAREPPQP